jgi:hypothetical protein
MNPELDFLLRKRRDLARNCEHLARLLVTDDKLVDEARKHATTEFVSDSEELRLVEARILAFTTREP